MQKSTLMLCLNITSGNPEEIETEAELLLRFLVEINAEKSDELLNNFVFKLKFTNLVQKKT